MSPYIVRDGLVYAVVGRKEEDSDSQEQQLPMVLPELLRDIVLYSGHETAGHFGTSKMKALISQHLY